MLNKFAQAILGGAASSPSVERLETWSKIASKRFIDEGAPLNETITKIAQENDLNPHFVERLCEMSNLCTHNTLLPSEPEKRASFTFTLADAKEVTAALAGPCPGKPMVSDFAGPPRGLPGEGPSMAELFGVSGGGHSGFEVPEKKRIVIMIQKKAAERERKYSELLKTAMQLETAELQFHSAVKQAVMQGSSLEEIHEASCHAGYGDVSRETLPKTAQLLNKQFLVSDQDLEKVAFEAPEELIDRNVPVTVVNGRNPIIASIDALKKYRDNTYCIRDGLMGIDQEVEILRQKLKELE
jgi:hypothetical protein